MKKTNSVRLIVASFLVIFLFSGGACFSQKKSSLNTSDGSEKLLYNYPVEKVFKYKTSTRMVQDMNIDGQSMLVNGSSYLACSIKFTEKLGADLKFEIGIDSMGNSIETPQGNSGGDVNEARGRFFNMVISPNGKTKDLSEAAKIALNVPGSGPGDASQTFIDFFPILPAGPVKVGDTWITHDTADVKSPTMTRWMPVESNYKFEGIEKYNGVDCAKLTALLSGSMKITNQTQGMDIETSGTFTGTRTLFFAVREGYFIKEAAATKMTGTVNLINQNMSFPVVMDVTSTNELVK
jgi:hypothetical protein